MKIANVDGAFFRGRIRGNYQALASLDSNQQNFTGPLKLKKGTIKTSIYMPQCLRWHNLVVVSDKFSSLKLRIGKLGSICFCISYNRE